MLKDNAQEHTLHKQLMMVVINEIKYAIIKMVRRAISKYCITANVGGIEITTLLTRTWADKRSARSFIILTALSTNDDLL